MKFDDIENAFLFVSMAPKFTNRAILSKETGAKYTTFQNLVTRMNCQDVDYADKYIAIPHRKDLDLGKTLVLKFVSEYLPDDLHEVTRIFNRKGAYARFKQLLESKGMLDKWHAYEDRMQETTLREWCAENSIELTG